MGIEIETRITTIDMTISSSIKVNPKVPARRDDVRDGPESAAATSGTDPKATPRLPLRVRSSICRLFSTLGVHVEDVLASPAHGLRVILHAALSPIGGIG